jgi:hypothetical protein
MLHIGCLTSVTGTQSSAACVVSGALGGGGVTRLFRHVSHGELNHTVQYYGAKFRMTVLHCHKLNQMELMSTSISAWNEHNRAKLDERDLNEKWQPLVKPSVMALKYSSRWRAGRLMMWCMTELQLSAHCMGVKPDSLFTTGRLWWTGNSDNVAPWLSCGGRVSLFLSFGLRYRCLASVLPRLF